MNDRQRAAEEVKMKKILVSECLYGGRAVRYDGGMKEEKDPRFLKWKEEGRLIPVCPEVFGGLPIPRPDSQRKGDRVVSRNGRDVTEEYMKGARMTLEIAKAEGVSAAILKENSPSCGVEMIHDGNFSGVKVPGRGVTTELLIDAGFTVFSEKQLDQFEEYLAQLERDV